MKNFFVIRFMKNQLRKVVKLFISRKIPFKGYANSTFASPLDKLSDEDLSFLNNALDWNCFTTDANGRRFGNVAWSGKRCVPQEIPDARIVMMNEKFNLSDKTVLEVGCFEGVHTIGLQMYSKNVIAVDSRIQHIVKTVVRANIYGFSPRVFQFDADNANQPHHSLSADLCHHVGVLYHLKDPVSHIMRLGEQIRLGIMLDTHIASEKDASESYLVEGQAFSYKKYLEFGAQEAFSGMHDHSKWLTLDSLKLALQMAGFNQISIVGVRDERNGLRVLLFAEK